MKALREVDVDDLRARGSRYAGVAAKGAGQGAVSARKTAELARRNLELRVRPRRRPSRVPLVAVLVAGAAVAGAVGYLLYDRERRARVLGRAARLQHDARSRYAELGGLTGAVDKVRTRVATGAPELDEAALEEQVRKVVDEGGAPVKAVKVSVEGRTVYLRGAVHDPAAVDAAAERVHGVDGVVAVVNLTTTPARAGSGNSKKSQ
jgi:BON domain-containing protein